MSELMAINKVSSGMGISSRTLRYWEIPALRNISLKLPEDSLYRFYSL